MILDRWKRNWANRINVGNYSNRILDKYRHPRNRCYLLFYLLSVGYRTFCNVFSFIYLFFFFSQHTVHGDTECNVPTSNVPSGLSFPRWRGDIVKFQIRFKPIRQRFVSCHHREARVLQLRDSEERGYRPIYTRFEG